jgi:predicted Zn-ribbon and HTH transcriptional regulator
MFAGVPVFGDGRIAVRLPKQDESPNPQFLSFSLSEFRRFSKILEEFYGLQGLGADCGIPLEDVFSERYCHFSNQPLRILEHIEFYKDDAGFKLKVIGYKCAGCGLVVSEESREKEQIGGKAAKKIAKAKCPKCKKPFGDLPQFSLDIPEPSAK